MKISTNLEIAYILYNIIIGYKLILYKVPLYDKYTARELYVVKKTVQKRNIFNSLSKKSSVVVDLN